MLFDKSHLSSLLFLSITDATVPEATANQSLVSISNRQ